MFALDNRLPPGIDSVFAYHVTTNAPTRPTNPIEFYLTVLYIYFTVLSAKEGKFRRQIEEFSILFDTVLSFSILSKSVRALARLHLEWLGIKRGLIANIVSALIATTPCFMPVNAA